MRLTDATVFKIAMLVAACAATTSARPLSAQHRFSFKRNGPTDSGLRLIPRLVDFSLESELLAMPCSDDRVLLWDLREAKEVAALDHAGGRKKAATLHALWFLGDGRTLAALYSGEGTLDPNLTELVLFDVPTRSERGSIPIGTVLSPYAVAFSPDGQKLVLARQSPKGRRRTCDVNVWDVATAKQIQRIDTAPDCLDAEFSADGRWLATVHGISAAKAQIILWDAATFERRRVLPAGGSWLRLAFSPDSKQIAAGFKLPQPRGTPTSFVMKTWDVNSGKQLGVAEIDFGDDRESVDISPLFSRDSQSLVADCGSAGFDRAQIELCDLTSGEHRMLTRGKGAGRDFFSRADFSLDGALLATGVFDSAPEITLWDTKYWNVLRRLEVPRWDASGQFLQSIDLVRFSRDGKWLAALVADRKKATQRKQGHQHEVMLWNLAETLDAPSGSLAPRLDR